MPRTGGQRATLLAKYKPSMREITARIKSKAAVRHNNDTLDSTLMVIRRSQGGEQLQSRVQSLNEPSFCRCLLLQQCLSDGNKGGMDTCLRKSTDFTRTLCRADSSNPNLLLQHPLGEVVMSWFRRCRWEWKIHFGLRPPSAGPFSVEVQYFPNPPAIRMINAVPNNADAK